jgi:hypothetical protein
VINTQAGVSAGVVNVVTGYGAEVGEHLLRHPGVDKVAFTGSTAVDDIAIGPTNVVLSTTFRMRTTREWDPELKRWITTREPPSVTVQATGYPPAAVELR